MDGRGRWMDNVFIERLWRNLKYECIYLNAFETGSELRAGLTWWIGYYNARRPHSTLDGRTPDDTYWASGIEKLPRQKNLWATSGSGSLPSAWYSAVSVTWKVRKP